MDPYSCRPAASTRFHMSLLRDHINLVTGLADRKMMSFLPDSYHSEAFALPWVQLLWGPRKIKEREHLRLQHMDSNKLVQSQTERVDTEVTD